MTYDFDFTWDGPYGRVVGLLRDHVVAAVGAGLVVDLGCGHAAVAAPLADLGVGYLGLDVDPVTVRALVDRGVEAAVLDLSDAANIASVLDDAVAGRTVAAVIALDVVEHLADPVAALLAVHRWMTTAGVDALAVSIPNVSHVDLASKLLAARWDVTQTGLLDVTHLRLFTEPSLTTLMRRCGFAEAARDDVRLIFSDQAWPPDHPTVSPDSMLGRYLRNVRHLADDHGETNQFVRVYRRVEPLLDDPSTLSAGLVAEPRIARRRPFLSVITRTQGRRATLLDALTCLAAQDDDDLEVLLVVNTPDDTDAAAVDRLLDSFDERFRDRVRTIRLPDAHRVRSLNAGLDAATGRYLAVLDDDDLVTGGWCAGFRALADAHPGAVLRCLAADQPVAGHVAAGAAGPTAIATAGFAVPYRARFDLASHLAGGQSPQGTVAFPMEAVVALRARFDESLEVCEDLDFLMWMASICGVADSGEVAMVYRRWEGSEASLQSVAPAVWEAALQHIVARLDAGPMLVAPGSATRLFQAAVQERELYELSLGERTLVRRTETAERNWATVTHQYRQLEQYTHDVVADRDHWQARAELAERRSLGAVPRRAASGVLRRLRRLTGR